MGTLTLKGKAGFKNKKRAWESRTVMNEILLDKSYDEIDTGRVVESIQSGELRRELANDLIGTLSALLKIIRVSRREEFVEKMYEELMKNEALLVEKMDMKIVAVFLHDIATSLNWLPRMKELFLDEAENLDKGEKLERARGDSNP